MDWHERIRAALAHALAERSPNDDVVDELAQHARAMYETARADGASRDEAERRVDLQIALWAGDAALLTRRSRQATAVIPPPALSSSPMDALAQDVRYAGRLLTRQQGFTLLVVCTMALAIGGATLLFSLTYGVLMKPLPWPHADRLVLLEETRGGQPPRFQPFTNAAYLAWREQMSTIEDVAAWTTPMLTLDGAGDPERLRVTAATASLFPVLGLRPLLVLLAAVLLLLVTATANVASLQLARATTRRREMAIRGALGAGAGRVARQLLAESTLLGLAGGAAGLALAAVLHRALPSLLPADFPRLDDVGVNAAVVGFALGLSVLASIASGLLPALRTRHLNLVESLTQDGAAPVGARMRSPTARVRALIMAGQVAIACILLIGASLVSRSFLALVHADRGFDPANVLTARVQLPAFAYTPERRTELVGAILERLRDVPGVTAASYTDYPPLGVYGGTAFWVDDRAVQAASRWNLIPGYFAAMGMRFVGGRDFTDEDIATTRPVFIVNRSFAREYLGDNAVGQRVRGWVKDVHPEWEVIGVVDDVRHRGVTSPSEPEVYRYRKREDHVSTAPTFIVRTSGDPAALVPTLRALARQQDHSLVFDSVMTMEDRVLTSLARPRLYAVLLGAFAGLALLIAAVGLFGVLSYTVSQRSRELAVRTALGARPIDIVRLVAAQGLAVTVAGLAAGLLGSVVLTRTLAALLYGVTRHDVLTYVAVPLVLLLVAAVACVVPARRAARLDPLRVLREG